MHHKGAPRTIPAPHAPSTAPHHCITAPHRTTAPYRSNAPRQTARTDHTAAPLYVPRHTALHALHRTTEAHTAHTAVHALPPKHSTAPHTLYTAQRTHYTALHSTTPHHNALRTRSTRLSYRNMSHFSNRIRHQFLFWQDILFQLRNIFCKPVQLRAFD